MGGGGRMLAVCVLEKINVCVCLTLGILLGYDALSSLGIIKEH